MQTRLSDHLTGHEAGEANIVPVPHVERMVC
jgi:hypothetical protein